MFRRKFQRKICVKKKLFGWLHFSLFFEELPEIIRLHNYCGQVRLAKYACALFL